MPLLTGIDGACKAEFASSLITVIVDQLTKLAFAEVHGFIWGCAPLPVLPLHVDTLTRTH